MPLWASPFLGADWVAATHSSLGVIYKLGLPMMMHYLRQMFTDATPQLQSGQPLTAARAAVEGLVFGLGQGLPVSAGGQSFAWPYLLQRTAILPGTDPGPWTVCLLAAAVGLAVVLRASWAGTWRSLRTRRAQAGAPEGVTLLAAVVACWLIQLRLGPWSLRFEAAAAVGLLLALTGQALNLSDRWGRQRTPSRGGGDRIPLWLALIGGLLAGFAALPGLSALAILLAAGLYGRLSTEGAGRFALMTATGVLALQGLAGLPAAATQFHPAFLVLAAGAAVGAAAGGWLLLALLRAAAQRALPVMASYCTALGGLLRMFGVLQR